MRLVALQTSRGKYTQKHLLDPHKISLQIVAAEASPAYKRSSVQRSGFHLLISVNYLDIEHYYSSSIISLPYLQNDIDGFIHLFKSFFAIKVELHPRVTSNCDQSHYTCSLQCRRKRLILAIARVMCLK